jgi:hypothetical protein
MATKADFTDGEWSALQRGVTGAGMLVSVSDADFTDSFGEASALAKYLAEQREKGETELIRELSHVHGSGFGLTASPQKIQAETLEALDASVATLSVKAPDEVEPYRRLVMAVAEAVAEAKGGVKDDEAAAIAAIKGAVGAA